MIINAIEWLLSLFAKHSRLMMVAIFSLACVAKGYHWGYGKAESIYQKKLTDQKTAFDLEKLNATNTALSKEKAANDKATRLSYELARLQRQLTQQEQSRHEQINQAVKEDGSSFTGIGPDSVQLYRQALGYPNASGNSLSSATSKSASNTANAGLSPVALLNHANSYGAWCLTMREQLIELNKLYGGEHGRN